MMARAYVLGEKGLLIIRSMLRENFGLWILYFIHIVFMVFFPNIATICSKQLNGNNIMKLQACRVYLNPQLKR